MSVDKVVFDTETHQGLVFKISLVFNNPIMLLYNWTPN